MNLTKKCSNCGKNIGLFFGTKNYGTQIEPVCRECNRKTKNEVTKAFTFEMGDPVADVLGNVYKTVKIGNQLWTMENLRTTKYNDGSPIPFVSSQKDWEDISAPAFCCYDDFDDESDCGFLYNWYVVNSGKLAPKGWKIPSIWDWGVLTKFLIKNGYNWDGTKEDCKDYMIYGDKLYKNKIGKSLAVQFGWGKSVSYNDSEPYAGNIGVDLTKNNKSGFSALPGGYRCSNGVFYGSGFLANWWGADSIGIDSSTASSFTLNSHWEELNFNIKVGEYKSAALSVRLIKDNDKAI